MNLIGGLIGFLILGVITGVIIAVMQGGQENVIVGNFP